jgi:hypothetical protein
MNTKYGTDELGNVWYTFAQIEPVGGTVCYNPEKETLEQPPVCPIGKRPIVENGQWKIIPIAEDCITENGVIRRKNQNERFRDGLDEMPKGMKIEVDGDKLNLVPKTLEEQLSSSEITQEQYNEIKNVPIKAELEMLDVKSVRSIREWLVKQPDCPQYLKQYDDEAKLKRDKLVR